MRRGEKGISRLPSGRLKGEVVENPAGRSRPANEDSGFTLLELLVVMAILATLTWIVAPRFLGEPEKARRLKAEITIANLETALKTYYLDNGFFPTTDQGLEALVREPDTEPIPGRWREDGYLEKGKVPQDPWGHDFIYLSPGLHGDFDLISYGADGMEGGEGRNADIQSWTLE